MFKSLLDFSSYETLAALATVIFFVLFVAMVVLALRLKKSYVRQMESLPLEPDDEHHTALKEQE